MNWSDCAPTGTATIACLEPLFARTIEIVTLIAGFLFLVMFVVGGLKYLFSGGNPKRAESAKGTITSAFIGLVLVVGAYIILNIIAGFVGLPSLTIFKIVSFP
ncbi:MAG: hypothetical protein UR98_C0020G0005 [Parcubacteria group bacterium GW2011_GWA1_36_12]|nr:MAG: hypothetical protein UR98_C0020G0005 [Parcubacteria group bacterium GW2011_GWA1_36_12]